MTRKRTSKKGSKDNKRKMHLPKTAKVKSRKSKYALGRQKFNKANQEMTMTQLQFMAKSRGIPFGGLSKNRLVHKINNYY